MAEKCPGTVVPENNTEEKYHTNNNKRWWGLRLKWGHGEETMSRRGEINEEKSSSVPCCNDDHMVRTDPYGVCVNIERFITSSLTPFARFARTFFVEGHTYPPSLLRGLDPSLDPFPSPPPCTWTEAGLNGPDSLLANHERQKNLYLLF